MKSVNSYHFIPVHMDQHQETSEGFAALGLELHSGIAIFSFFI